MKSFDELLTGIRPLLEEFEERRIALKAKCVKAVCGGVLVAIALIGTTAMLGALNPIIILVGLVLAVLGPYLWVSGDLDLYKKSFKHDIVGRVVDAIDPALDYHPDRRIGESDYMASRIFLTNPDRYRGEDYVSGTLGATAVRFSEIHSEYKTETRDSKGNRRTRWHTIFKGVFFIADFNKHFEQDTVVLPDTAEKLFGRLGKMFQKMNLRQEKLVTLEDPEFEKLFAVYADDEVEARYILTPGLMRRLVKFRQTTGNLYISFTGSCVNVGVATSRNLFEPRVFKTIIDPDLIREYYDDLDFFAGIVDELNLNTRIWTKE